MHENSPTTMYKLKIFSRGYTTGPHSRGDEVGRGAVAGREGIGDGEGKEGQGRGWEGGEGRDGGEERGRESEFIPTIKF